MYRVNGTTTKIFLPMAVVRSVYYFDDESTHASEYLPIHTHIHLLLAVSVFTFSHIADNTH